MSSDYAALGFDTTIGESAAPLPSVGEDVEVRPGVMDAEHPDLSLTGWRGRIKAVDAKEGTVVVAWDSATSLAIPDHYIRLCTLQGVDWASMVLEAAEVQPCTEPRDAAHQRAAAPECAESAAVQTHIRIALHGFDRTDLAACLRAWIVYIHNHVAFPFAGEVLEDPLAASAVPPGTVVIVTRLCGVDGATGLLAEVHSGHRKCSMPIASVRPTPYRPETLPLRAYATWFARRN